MKRQGIYTFTPKNAVLLRNISISAPIRKSGRGGYLIAAASRFSLPCKLEVIAMRFPFHYLLVGEHDITFLFHKHQIVGN